MYYLTPFQSSVGLSPILTEIMVWSNVELDLTLLIIF